MEVQIKFYGDSDPMTLVCESLIAKDDGKTIAMGKKASREMLEEMLRMQADLDAVIIKGRGHSYDQLYGNNSYDRAILDELGELNHELKAEWCWWKSSQKPVVRERVLEEFVDVLHFSLSEALATDHVGACGGFNMASYIIDRCLEHVADKDCEVDQGTDVLDIIDWGKEKGPALVKAVKLMNWLGFTLEEVFNAYKAKNAVNFQRQREGY
ncbi:dUTP diphosphatase [Faecalibaculum rodentium]|uniref:dUTP diphosphatase n=1 Tax=Faecalibaculum rodentium TaxID=1702221 RepID=UPI0023F1E893|nr:dUTP diphosphatase [Faecalibaculum rodentium]